MIYNFKKQFVPFVLNGTKTHTIRGERRDGKVEQVGAWMHNYTGLRQPGAQLLFRAPCVAVEPVVIEPRGIGVELGGVRLNKDELDLFAWRDGFRLRDTTEANPGRAWDFMLRYWMSSLHPAEQASYRWQGFCNHWDYQRKTKRKDWKTLVSTNERTAANVRGR